MARVRKGQETASNAPSRQSLHLRQEEHQRVQTLKASIMKKRGVNNFDVPAVLELVYLRVLGRVESRAPVEKELKELKSLLDQAGAKTTQILEESARTKAS